MVAGRERYTAHHTHLPSMWGQGDCLSTDNVTDVLRDRQGAVYLLSFCTVLCSTHTATEPRLCWQVHVQGAEVKMKCSLTFSLLVSCALLGLGMFVTTSVDVRRKWRLHKVLSACLSVTGAAIKCFSCKDDKASCNEQRNCIYENACLTFVETGTCVLITQIT